MKLLLLILNVFLISSCATTKTTRMPNETYFLRLKPGMLLKEEIAKFVEANNIRAGWVSACAGNLTHYNIRFSNMKEASSSTGFFEIVSLSGTLSAAGSHLHISVADSAGKVIGGHLMGGCIIYTTAEIVIQSSSEYELSRSKDGTTEWEELQIKKL